MEKSDYVMFSNPVGSIHTSKAAFDSEAPIVAGFSSPGPNMITPEILKVVSSINQEQLMAYFTVDDGRFWCSCICMDVAA